MPIHDTGRPDNSPHLRRHRPPTLAALILLSASIALILFVHGIAWWFAPASLAALLLGHASLAGAIAFGVAKTNAGASPPTNGAPTHADHVDEGPHLLSHGSFVYDLFTQAITLGREGKLRRWTVDLADLRPGDAVLDVGCGTGSLLLAAAERVGPTGSLHGIEPSPDMRDRAEQKAKARGVSLAVLDGLAEQLPYSPASFDAVFCTLALHHVAASKRETAVAEFRRVLRPGGRLVIVEWLAPTSKVRAVFDPLAIVFLLHGGGVQASPFETLGIDSRLGGLGFRNITWHRYGSGVITAIVGRIPPD